MEACCLITRLRRPRILWRLMFSLNQYQSNHNVYVFPPFILVGPLLWYLFNQGQRFAFTVVDVRFSHLGSLFYVELVPRDLFSYLVLYTRFRVEH